jgi:hypothetical protein
LGYSYLGNALIRPKPKTLTARRPKIRRRRRLAGILKFEADSFLNLGTAKKERLEPALIIDFESNRQASTGKRATTYPQGFGVSARYYGTSTRKADYDWARKKLRKLGLTVNTKGIVTTLDGKSIVNDPNGKPLERTPLYERYLKEVSSWGEGYRKEVKYGPKKDRKRDFQES